MKLETPLSWELVNRMVTSGKFLSAIDYKWAKGSIEHRKIFYANFVASFVHGSDKRYNGDPYLYHLQRTALYLVYKFENVESDDVVAALLHDAPEMHSYTCSLPFIKRTFGSTVSALVEPITEPSKLCFGDNLQAHQRAKFNQVRAGGMRSVRLKLVDRLDNTKTLIGNPRYKREQLRETIRFILPLAHRHGMMCCELRDAVIEQYASRNIDNRIVA